MSHSISNLPWSLSPCPRPLPSSQVSQTKSRMHAASPTAWLWSVIERLEIEWDMYRIYIYIYVYMYIYIYIFIYKYICNILGDFLKWKYPSIIHFKRSFSYKPPILVFRASPILIKFYLMASTVQKRHGSEFSTSFSWFIFSGAVNKKWMENMWWIFHFFWQPRNHTPWFMN